MLKKLMVKTVVLKPLLARDTINTRKNRQLTYSSSRSFSSKNVAGICGNSAFPEMPGVPSIA